MTDTYPCACAADPLQAALADDPNLASAERRQKASEHFGGPLRPEEIQGDYVIRRSPPAPTATDGPAAAAGHDARVGSHGAPLTRAPGAAIFQHWLTRRRSFLATVAQATPNERRAMAQLVARYLRPLCDLPATHWLAVWEELIDPLTQLHDNPARFHRTMDGMTLGERSELIVGLADQLGETMGAIVEYIGESRARCVALGMLN